MKTNYTRHYVHRFDDLDNAPFDPKQYSKMKFGSDAAAKLMGYKLADDVFLFHAEKIIANRCVVIPSPYNYIQNAATIMTKHFIDRLNHLSVNAKGEPVEYSIIHRKVSYTNDYGFLSKEQRKQLIDNDSFYFNTEFIKDKLLIFIDDVYITGTHEEKLIEIMERDGVKNDSLFLYYARYFGNSPDVEAAINFAEFRTFDEYMAFVLNEQPHMIVRPLKYILSQSYDMLKGWIRAFTDQQLNDIYNGCLAEGYYKLPKYQRNFNIIVEEINRRKYNLHTI